MVPLLPTGLVLAIALVVRFVFMRRGWGCWSRAGRPGDRARGILDERYARGEIGDDEYRTRAERLQGDG